MMGPVKMEITMRKVTDNLLLQGISVIAVIVLSVGDVNAMGSSRQEQEKIPLPETSNHYGWFKAQRLRFDNGKRYKYANAAIIDGNYVEAERIFKEILKADPGNNRAKLGLINIYSKQKKWDKAIAISDELLKTYPDFVDGYQYRGALAGMKDDTAIAISSYKKVIEKTRKKDARHVNALREISELYFEAGDYKQARNYAGRLLKNNETLALRMFLAECDIKLKDYSAALENFNKALPLADKNTQKGKIQLARGFILYKQGKLDEAEKAFEETLRLIPETKERLKIVKQLGDIAYRQKDYTKAETRFKSFLQQQFDEDVEAAYIEVLIKSEKWEQAQLEAFDYIAKDNLSEKFHTRLLMDMVQIYKHNDNPAMTYKIAKQAYGITHDKSLLLEMAFAAERLGMPQEAIQHYNDYLADNFEVAPAFSYYYLLKRQKKYDEAGVILDKLLVLKKLSPALQDEVLYEKAQIFRETDQMPEYYKTMDQLIARNDNYRYIMEYASRLFGDKEYDRAIELYKKCLDKNPDKKSSYQICCGIAEVYLAQNQPEKSIEWLENALKYDKPDVVWQLIMAQIEYNAGDYKACVNRLLTVNSEEKNDFVNIYIGFSFYRMNMPGLALYHLNQVKDLGKLTSEQRYVFFSNRAFLNYDQGQYKEALSDVENALSIKRTEDMQIVQLKTLVALAEYEKARDIALKILDEQNEILRKNILDIVNNSDDSDLKSALLKICNENYEFFLPEVLDAIHSAVDVDLKVRLMALLSDTKINNMAKLYKHIGLCELRLDNYEEAVDYLSAAIALDKDMSSAWYLRGIAYHKLEKDEEAEQDLLTYQEISPVISRKFWGDLAAVEGALKQYDKGIKALNTSLEIYPYDIDTLEEAGYQYMKAVSNEESKASFAAAVTIYNEIIPLLSGSNQLEYTTNDSAMKREYTKLDRVFGGGIYFSKTDYDLPSPAAVASINGALPSQAGVELNYRPPIIGFRNERTLDIFGRIYGNFQNNSWRLDTDSFQVGFGVRYKAFRKSNVILSAEKLTKFGKNSEDNFLVRVLDSIEWGEKPKGDKKYQFAGRLYGDIGAFLQDRQRWYYYLDGRMGMSWYVGGTKVLLTLPQVLGVVRHETDDVSNYLSYDMVGIGLNGRILEPEHAYTIERAYIDIYLHYVWGWFWDKPVDLDDKSFEGVVFGASLVK